MYIIIIKYLTFSHNVNLKYSSGEMNFTKCNTKVILHPYIYSEFCYSSYFTLVSLIIILSTDVAKYR